MNIFYLHRDPVKAAKIQYNKHVVKMILESAQMLCTAHHHYAAELNYPMVEFRIRKRIIIIHQLYGADKTHINTCGCISIC